MLAVTGVAKRSTVSKGAPAKRIKKNHDLGNPLTIVWGYVQLLARPSQLDREGRRFDPGQLPILNATLIPVIIFYAAGVSRVGLFSRTRKGDPYQLRAGLHCLPETEELQFGERDALVRWFESHAHLISRANLLRTQDHRQRTIMRRALDMFGAEAIVPLYARGSIIGWVFFGQRVTGRLFDDRDLEGLTTLAEHVSTILENALLYEEATVQKTLAETLLKSIPPGIVAIDEDAIVRWFNPPAEKILGLSGAAALNKPVESVGTRLAGLLRETLESKTPMPPQHWIGNNTQRSLSVETRQLAGNGSPRVPSL